MTHCCSPIDLKKVCNDFNCKVNETDKGIQINLEPKDDSKVKPLQNFVKAYKEFFGCEC